jgi:Tfp pilus assembly protein PilF
MGATALVVGWCVLCAQAIPWLADLQIKASAAAIRENDGTSALRHALNAKSMQPWAASPYLQLALVQEQRGELPQAAGWLRKAIARDPIDWRLWLVEARLDTKRGRILAANQALNRAIELNPKSPLLAGLRRPR